jgi:dihydroflavonol-4-reductase
VIVTGSIACVGYTPDPTRPYDETHYNSKTSSSYIRAKCEQERVAVEMGKTLDLDVMVALPTAVFGSLDYRMTPASRAIRDVFNGGPVTFGLNVVHPRDVADGMVLMWKKGRRGERYLLGGDNTPQREMAELVARLTGGKPKAMTPPKLLLKLIGHVSVLAARIKQTDAELDPAAVDDVAGCHFVFDTSKARRELGYAPRGPQAVLTDSLRWLLYRRQLSPKTARRIHDRYPPDPAWRDGV